jgi:glutathione synthase/RimK-type ligase-like ATP-grasp enzyme
MVLHTRARQRGWDSELFRKPEEIIPGEDAIAFVRMNHNPQWRNRDKRLIRKLNLKGVQTIPNFEMGQMYDDKLKQFRLMFEYMPKTWIFRDLGSAVRWTLDQKYPFISKTSEGAGSKNVRLIETKEQAQSEAEKAFGEEGLLVHYGLRQQRYVLWQRYHPVECDYRVLAIGNRRLIIRRKNRDDRPMASGSGKIEFLDPESKLAQSAFKFVDQLVKKFQMPFIGVDLIQVPEGWLLLEVTSSWSLPAYYDALFDDGRKGCHFFDIILDEIEKELLP